MTPDYRPYVRVGDAPKSDQPWPLPARSQGEADDIAVANEMNAALTCIHCGAVVRHWADAEWWLRRTVLIDPEACDVNRTGEICPEADEHEVAP